MNSTATITRATTIAVHHPTQGTVPVPLSTVHYGVYTAAALLCAHVSRLTGLTVDEVAAAPEFALSTGAACECGRGRYTATVVLAVDPSERPSAPVGDDGMVAVRVCRECIERAV